MPSKRPHGSLPSDTFVNEDGDVAVPHDAGAETTDEFMYPAEKEQIAAWEATTKTELEDALFEDMMRGERKLTPQEDIAAQLAVIAVKRFFMLQDKVLEAQDRGDVAGKQRALAKLHALAERHPGLIEPPDSKPSEKE